MITSPYIYSAIAAQHQADLRDEVAAHRLARSLRLKRRAARREARAAIDAARLEAELAARRPVARPTPVAH